MRAHSFVQVLRDQPYGYQMSWNSLIRRAQQRTTAKYGLLGLKVSKQSRVERRMTRETADVGTVAQSNCFCGAAEMNRAAVRGSPDRVMLMMMR
jgi:hypothetical protein